MTIPKSIRIGKKRYIIKLQHIDEDFTTGYTVDNLIVIATSNNTKKTTNDEQILTFWHEVTHVILDHIRPKLSNDERFVEQFAETMHQIIKSARF